MKKLMVVLSVSCIVIVLAEVAGLAWLGSQGYLSSDRLRDVQNALTGSGEEEPTEPSEKERGIALQVLLDERVRKTLELETREEELNQQLRMVVGQRDRVLIDKQALERQRKDFQDQLQILQQQTTAAATERTRAILLSIAPADAVVHLMEIDFARNVTLLKGLPEKSIGKILKEFQLGDDKTRERGIQIFDALSQGQPVQALLDGTVNQLNASEPQPATGV